MMDNAIRIRNKKLGEKVVSNLRRRLFDAYYADTAAEACALALSLIPEGGSVSWGGSATAVEIGLIQALREGNYRAVDRDPLQGEARMEAMRQALLCDSYVMGANAISEDGQLVNIDRVGNRVAAMCYGPKNVIVVAGINKIAPTAEDAVKRARHTAAPINMQRFEGATGCSVTGACTDCTTPDCLCSYIVTTRVCRPAGKIKVILVGEELGY